MDNIKWRLGARVVSILDMVLEALAIVGCVIEVVSKIFSGLTAFLGGIIGLVLAVLILFLGYKLFLSTDMNADPGSAKTIALLWLGFQVCWVFLIVIGSLTLGQIIVGLINVLIRAGMIFVVFRFFVELNEYLTGNPGRGSTVQKV